MADRHKEGLKPSKYTADRQMPGAFEGETVTRRRFMTAVTHGAGGVAAAAFTLPALGFAIQTYHDDFAEAAKVQRAVGFKPGDAVIVDNIQGAFLKEHPGIFPGVSVLGASFALWDEKMKAEVFKSFEWFRTCPPRTGAGAGAAE